MGSVRLINNRKKAVAFFNLGLASTMSSGTFMAGGFQQVPRDVQLMNLASAFIDAECPDIAIKALDAKSLHVTLPAEDLYDPIGHPTTHLGCVIFAKRDFHRDVFAAIALARGFKAQGPRRLDFDLAISEHRLDQLKLADGASGLLALQRVAYGFVEHADGGAGRQRRQIDALLVQHLHHRPEAIASLADDAAFRHAAVPQQDLADRRAFGPFSVSSPMSPCPAFRAAPRMP